MDATENVYVVGATTSADFPTTSDAYDTTYNGDLDAFVMKLATNRNALIYSTFLGSSEYDFCHALAIDPLGSVYIAGRTFNATPTFPIIHGAYSITHSGGLDAFVAKLVNLPEIPGQVQELTVIVGENQQIVLFWAENPWDGNSPIISYHIYRGISSGIYSYLAVTTNEYFYDTGAVVGQTYYYVVTAVNIAGESAFSNEVNAIRQIASFTVPDAPQSLNAVAGELRVTLSWQEPSNDGGSPITGYRVYRGTTSGTFSVIFPTVSTSYIDLIVIEHTTYYYVITAINEKGESVISNEVSATPTSASTTSTTTTTTTISTTSTTTTTINTTTNEESTFPELTLIFLSLGILLVLTRRNKKR